MRFSSELSEKIAATLKAFVADTEPYILNFEDPIDLRKVAAELNILPMSLNFAACYAIRPDGEIVVIDFDEDAPYKLHLETEPRICRLVLCQGAKKYPELSEIVPTRPIDAEDCLTCGGAGIHPINQELGFDEERIVCWCGGLGWLPKDEKQPS